MYTIFKIKEKKHKKKEKHAHYIKLLKHLIA